MQRITFERLLTAASIAGKISAPAMALALLLAVPSVGKSQKLESLFSKSNSFQYNGYTVVRTFDAKELESRTVLKRGKTELVTVEGYGYEDSTRFAVFSLLGTANKQLIIESYSGGGHCCYAYYVADLGSRFRVLFDGENYSDNYSPDDVGYPMKLADLDKDGRYEFVQSVMSFDYFNMSHAVSVFPEVVFAYDPRKKKYQAANRRFSSYLLRDIGKIKPKLDRLNGLNPAQRFNDISFRVEYHRAVLNVILTYIYAGQETTAWNYFDKTYKPADKTEFRRAIVERLKSSAIYRSIN